MAGECQFSQSPLFDPAHPNSRSRRGLPDNSRIAKKSAVGDDRRQTVDMHDVVDLWIGRNRHVPALNSSLFLWAPLDSVLCLREFATFLVGHQPLDWPHQTRSTAFAAQADRPLTGGRRRALSGGVGTTAKAATFVSFCVVGARDLRSAIYASSITGPTRYDAVDADLGRLGSDTGARNSCHAICPRGEFRATRECEPAQPFQTVRTGEMSGWDSSGAGSSGLGVGAIPAKQ